MIRQSRRSANQRAVWRFDADERYNTAMNADIDIALSARMLLDRYGEDATLIAAQGEFERRERGDENGAEIWKRIMDAVEQLMQQSAVPSDTLPDHYVLD